MGMQVVQCISSRSSQTSPVLAMLSRTLRVQLRWMPGDPCPLVQWAPWAPVGRSEHPQQSVGRGQAHANWPPACYGQLKTMAPKASLTAPCWALLACHLKLSLKNQCREEKEMLSWYSSHHLYPIPFNHVPLTPIHWWVASCHYYCDPVFVPSFTECWPFKFLASFARIAFKWAELPLPYGRKYSGRSTLWWTNKKQWKMAIYSGFSHEKWWFSMAKC